jgi:hypothetical protein
MCEVILNRKQIGKLTEIVNHFKEIQHFTVTTDSSSGIGTGVVVKFTLFDTNDSSVDITDVSEW